MEKKKKKKNDLGRKLYLTGFLFLPITVCLFIVSLYSQDLIKKPLSIVLIVLSIAFIAQIIAGIVISFKRKNRKFKKVFKILIIIFFAFYYIGAAGVMVLFYGPNHKFRNWLITSAMTTMEHQYFATWFYGDDIISSVLDDNVVIEVAGETDDALVTVGSIDFDKLIFKNEYDEQVLTKEKGNDLYKIIDIKRDGYRGKLAVVYDPSKVKIGVSNKLGTSLATARGQFLVDISKRYNAVVAINASGFFDPGYNSYGGVPRGYVISDGKLLINNVWGRGYGGLVGFDKNNKLILSTSMTAKQAIEKGIRDGIQYGPFLVVNGKPSFIKGNGGWGIAPRTAIGQREDGIVLLLTIDGRQAGSPGADMGDLAQIMVDYGAINAVNMDGGTSTAMTLNHQIISNPRNGGFQPKTRPIPDAWIVVK